MSEQVQNETVEPRVYRPGYTWKRKLDYKVLSRMPSDELGVVLVEVRVPESHRISYEVTQIRWSPERMMGGTLIPAGERYPTNEEWGTYAWTHTYKPSAIKRMTGLIRSTRPSTQRSSKDL